MHSGYGRFRMTTKLNPQRFFWMVFVALLVACTPAQPNMTDIQSTAFAAAYTGVALTQTALPTATPPPPTDTPTATGGVILPTPPPTRPPFTPIMTPDAIQMEQWREYQTELAKTLFSQDPYLAYDPEKYKTALCEWDILGRSGEEVYTWAVCGPALSRDLSRSPAVIYLKPDGSIREVKVPDVEVNRQNQTVIYDLHLFPKDSQEKLCIHYFQDIVPQCGSIVPGYIPSEIVFVDRPRLYALLIHLEYRETYPEAPPLIILSGMPTATPTP